MSAESKSQQFPHRSSNLFNSDIFLSASSIITEKKISDLNKIWGSTRKLQILLTFTISEHTLTAIIGSLEFLDKWSLRVFSLKRNINHVCRLLGTQWAFSLLLSKIHSTRPLCFLVTEIALDFCFFLQNCAPFVKRLPSSTLFQMKM